MSVIYVVKNFVVEDRDGARKFEAGKVYHIHLWDVVIAIQYETAGKAESYMKIVEVSYEGTLGIVPRGHARMTPGTIGFGQALRRHDDRSYEPQFLDTPLGVEYAVRNHPSGDFVEWWVRQEGQLSFDDETNQPTGWWRITSPWGTEACVEGTLQEAHDIMLGLAKADDRQITPRQLEKIFAVRRFETTSFLPWKEVVLLNGLGLTQVRLLDENTDVFVSENPVGCVYHGGFPTVDGGRQQITAYQVKNGNHENVVVFRSAGDALLKIIALSSLREWEGMLKGDDEERINWLTYNRVDIQ